MTRSLNQFETLLIREALKRTLQEQYRRAYAKAKAVALERKMDISSESTMRLIAATVWHQVRFLQLYTEMHARLESHPVLEDRSDDEIWDHVFSLSRPFREKYEALLENRAHVPPDQLLIR